MQRCVSGCVSLSVCLCLSLSRPSTIHRWMRTKIEDDGLELTGLKTKSTRLTVYFLFLGLINRFSMTSSWSRFESVFFNFCLPFWCWFVVRSRLQTYHTNGRAVFRKEKNFEIRRKSKEKKNILNSAMFFNRVRIVYTVCVAFCTINIWQWNVFPFFLSLLLLPFAISSCVHSECSIFDHTLLRLKLSAYGYY